MPEVRDFIESQNLAFLDDCLRRNVRSYSMDINTLWYILHNKIKFFSRSKFYRLSVYDFFRDALITIYFEVIEKIYQQLHWNSEMKNKLSYLLNRENVRIVNHPLNETELLNLIETLDLKEEHELTRYTLIKNLGENWSLFLPALYEGNWLITKDKNIREIAPLYKLQAGFPRRIEYKGSWELYKFRIRNNKLP